jgi:glycyl-tRNA synthetase beta chain
MAFELLFEIGAEELPSSFVDGALAALPELVRGKLAAARLGHGEVQVFGTPRRLAVLVHGVDDAQTDLDETVIGPPEAAAYKDGKPTKAAEAFAAKCGTSVDALTLQDFEANGKQKAGRYVVGRRQEKGRPARDLLPAALAELCTQIPFRKSMRWGNLDATFGRPVQWLVALAGGEILPVTFAGISAGRETRGHRFLAPAPFPLANAADYAGELGKHHVIVDRNAREELMIARVAAAAQAAGGDYDRAQLLIDENASLVEEPFVVTGTYDPAFLALPAAVIRAVARGHQRYFCVEKSEDELLPTYLAVVNTANKPEIVAKGMDRVMRARLSDARFFYEEDKKAPIDARLAKLAGIVFHNRLGTVREKVDRIVRVAGSIADSIGISAEIKGKILEAAALCKFDLVSLMVGEFPELQGHMGRAYALHAGKDPQVADALRDHYKPVGASDAIAEDVVAAAVALADRVDTLVGCFAVGLEPTGSADPFALRRNVIAALRTVMENPALYTLDLVALFGVAYDALAEGLTAAGKKLDLSREETVKKLETFAQDRLRGLLAAHGGNGVADAVLAARTGTSVVAHPVGALARAKAIGAAVARKDPWLEKARTVAKRLAGISKDAKPALAEASAFTKETDATIVALVHDLDGATASLASAAELEAAVAKMEPFAKTLDEIFVGTLVNDPADDKTPARLALLSYGAGCMLRLGDFAKIQ